MLFYSSRLRGMKCGLVIELASAFPSQLLSSVSLAGTTKRQYEAIVWPILRKARFYERFEILKLACSTVLIGAYGWLAASEKRFDSPGFQRDSDARNWQVASVAEVGGLSSAFLSPEYRRNIFFIYEKRLRVHSPPEKVFEYFSSVKDANGTFMTSLDLMRAAVPVFQPAHSNGIRCGSLGGERGDPGRGRNFFSSLDLDTKPDFFKLFDTDGDGLISFPEYIFFITILSLPESEIKDTFQKFDEDGSGQLCRDEFTKMMRVMRKTSSRGNATGLRTGLKATNLDNISNGLVQFLFGEPGKEHKLSLEQFRSFISKMQYEIDLLEFRHYDFTNSGSISTQDFAYSIVAGANVQKMQYFISRAAKLASSEVGMTNGRVNEEQFMAFCRILKREGTDFQSMIKRHVKLGKKLTKLAFLDIAKELRAPLSEAQVDIIYFIFDVDGDGELSPNELLNVICRWDR